MNACWKIAKSASQPSKKMQAWASARPAMSMELRIRLRSVDGDSVGDDSAADDGGADDDGADDEGAASDQG